MTATFLPFAKPSIDQAAIDEVVDSLRSGWITTGPKVKRFETMLADYVSAKHALALASGTAGLHLALLSLDLQPGDEVITTALTFVSTLNTIVLAGAKPVLVDIERDTYNMDMKQLAQSITAKTRAIVPVHYAGLPVDLDAIYALAKKHNLRVLEDAAHAVGAEYNNQLIGSFGDMQMFSFHPNKNITTGEGGAIITRDDDIAKRIQQLRFHGIEKDAFNRFSKGGNQRYDVVAAGYKYNMMDIQAALGLHQLPRLAEFIDKRTDIVKRYYQALSDWPQWTLPKQPDYIHKHAWHLFTPLLNTKAAGMTRDEFINAMMAHNIGTGLHYVAPHLFSYYQKTWGYKAGDFPHAEYVGEHIVSLPLFPDMTDEQFSRIIDTMKNIFN